MTEAGLIIIEDAMTELGLNYGFIEYRIPLNEDGEEELVYPYFTGEYQEIEPMNEDGMQESTFIINGFTRTTWQELEEAKKKISNYFNKVGGKTVIADDGTAVAVFYSNSFIVPTGDYELKRIQINLIIKEWSVN